MTRPDRLADKHAQTHKQTHGDSSLFVRCVQWFESFHVKHTQNYALKYNDMHYHYDVTEFGNELRLLIAVTQYSLAFVDFPACLVLREEN